MARNDEKWMRLALSLARRGEGMTRPNPPVGAVLVRNGRMVGEGYHRKAGGPHAEVHALRQAGGRARGATLYVTLEPCSTWGRTPPCTDAILESRVATVVVSVRDPNPKHAGRGLALLRRHGVNVVTGVCQDDGEKLVAPFAKWIRTAIPYVTLKLGMTLDGKIADSAGQSRWITSAQSRARVQELRRRADGIMVGGKTALRDNPSLLPKPARGRAPFRIIIAGRARLAKRLRVFTDAAASRTIVIGGGRHRVNARAAMRELGRKGLLHVVCEGGGELAESLLKSGLVDELWLFLAPRILGGRTAPTAVGGAGWSLARALELKDIAIERVGADVLIRGKPR